MFDRNKLVHLVIWPQGKKSAYTLTDGHGEVAAQVEVDEPIKGSDLARMIPDGFYVIVKDCTVLTMSGKLVVATKAPFDTAVVTERAVVTAEDRLLRLERRERRREERAAAAEAENKELLRRLKEAEAVLEEPVHGIMPEAAEEVAAEIAAGQADQAADQEADA